jgi:hypothetical protein
MNWLTAVGNLLRHDQQQTSWAWVDRQNLYLLWDAYYDNLVYETIAQGGQRESINAALGNAQAADLAGLYNPVASAVDLYLHVFDGAFGTDILVEPDDAATQALVDAIEQVWTWGNMTIEKQPLCQFAANLGTCGLRIVARDDADLARRRVYIKPEHPRIIRDVELDERGNVQAIQLEYDLTYGLAEDAQTITIREEMDAERIATYRIDGNDKIPFNLVTKTADSDAVHANELGVVPYVLLRHQYTGEPWGRNCYYKMRGPIDRLNSLVSHIDIQIHQHVNGVLVIAAAGAPPKEIDVSGRKVMYIDTRGQAAAPFMQWMVATLDLAGALNQAKLQIDLIEDNLPELKAVGGKFLANQSGETVAELRKPAQDKLRNARANYEDALKRAQQIAVSWGILLELWDVGTGTGSREAADAAFHGGFENHHFNERPLLEQPAAAASAAPAAPEVDQQQTQTQQDQQQAQEQQQNGGATNADRTQSATQQRG